MGNDLTQRAMLVRLSIAQWSARKLDKRVTAEVNARHGAAPDAGRWNKGLVAKEALAKVKRVAGEARTFHYGNTLPWQDDGARILPANHFMAYSAKIRELEADFRAAVAEFVGEYPCLVQAAHGRLNGMYDPADYPSQAKVRGRFRFAVNVDPLPAADDFRVALGAEETERIKREISDRLQESTKAAMLDLWERLHSAVSHIAERLSGSADSDGKAKVFRDSLIANVQELCAILPALNLTKDPALESMRQRVESSLASRKPEELRNNAAERTETAGVARNIMDAMGAYMGAAE